jgi:putative MATE family efflux protein
MKALITPGAIWRVSYPLILAGVGETLIDATDVAILAHYGVTEAGAVALADAIYETFLVLVLGLLAGLQVVLARRAGQGSQAAVGAAFRAGLRLLLMASVVVFLLVRVAGPQMTGLLVSSDRVREAADVFLRVIVLGVGFEAVNLLLGTLYVGLGRTRILMVSTGVLVVTNVVLDYALVFGRFGCPELGIEGSAWGSVAAEAASFLVLAGYALVRGDARAYGLFRLRGFDRVLARRIALLSTPASLELLVETVRWFLFFVIVERMGEVPLAASNLVYTCYAVLLIPIEGIAETTCSLASRILGEGRATRLRALLLRSISIGYATSVPLALLAFLFPERILWIFTDDPGLVSASVEALRVAVLGLLLVPVGGLLIAALEGAGDLQGTLRIEFMVAAVVLLYGWVTALVLEQPLAVVWFFAPAGWGLAILLALVRLRSEAWRGIEV